jgi:hypothetical protein
VDVADVASAADRSEERAFSLFGAKECGGMHIRNVDNTVHTHTVKRFKIKICTVK